MIEAPSAGIVAVSSATERSVVKAKLRSAVRGLRLGRSHPWWYARRATFAKPRLEQSASAVRIAARIVLSA